MTTTTEETTQADTPGAATDDTDPLTGLTSQDHAVLLDAMMVITTVCQEAARRTLQAERPALEAEVTLAEHRTAEARSATRPGAELVARLQSELNECQKRGAELVTAADDEDLAVRLQARAMKNAVADETEAVHARLQEAAHANDPLNDVLRQAENDLRAARADLASLDAAITEPFAHQRGMGTEAFRVFSLRTGLWHESDGPIGRGIVDSYLRRTGYGETIERRAIAAYIAGDPAARQAGDTKTWADGTSLIRTQDGPPIVMNGRARPEDLAAAPPVPSPAPSGADAMAGMRNAAGQMPPPATVTKAASVEQEWQLPSAIRRMYR